jgi:ankyrin repeat protein
MKLKIQRIEGLLLVTLCCFMWGMEQQENDEQSAERDRIIKEIKEALNSDSPKMIGSLKKLYDLEIIGVNEPIFAGDTQTALVHIVIRANQKKTKREVSLMISVVRFLLSKGANPNASIGDTQIGDTRILNLAAEFHLSPIISLLLQAGADPNWQNTQGATALHNALVSIVDPEVQKSPTQMEEFHAIIKLILLSGANILLKNNEKKSIKDLLVEALAVDDKKNSPLKMFDQFLLAVIVNDRELVQQMCSGMSADELHLKINALDEIGFSVLHYAVVLRHEEIVDLLLSLGANWTVSIDGDVLLRLVIKRILQHRTELSKEKRDYYKNLLTKLYIKLALVAIKFTFPLILENDQNGFTLARRLPMDLIPYVFGFSRDEWRLIKRYFETDIFKKYFEKWENNAAQFDGVIASLPVYPERKSHYEQVLANFEMLLKNISVDKDDDTDEEDSSQIVATQSRRKRWQRGLAALFNLAKK